MEPDSDYPEVKRGEKPFSKPAKEISKYQSQPDPIKTPYITLWQAKSVISTLLYITIGLAITCIVVAFGFVSSLNRKPWVLLSTESGYEELSVRRAKVTRADVERFLNFTIPNLYGILNGESPGLKKLRGIINEAIISEQTNSLEEQKKTFQDLGISQFAIVTGLNPETLVINRERNFVYVEALGTIIMTRENRTKKTEVQWRCLMYIVEPTDALMSNTPAGKMQGNKMGLYLEQIAEQAPGTVNKDSPKPSLSDIQERQMERDKTKQLNIQ